MMKRSFAEAEFLRSETDRHKNLEALQRNIENFRDLDCPICDPEMDDYFKACSRITQLRNKMQVQNECVKLQLICTYSMHTHKWAKGLTYSADYSVCRFVNKTSVKGLKHVCYLMFGDFSICCWAALK